MHRRVTLDMNSISVVSFATSPEQRKVADGAHLGAVTRHTGDFCCEGTVCVTRAECSTNTCN